MDLIFSPYGVDAAAIAMPSWLELSGVIVGAFAGILVARGRNLDPIGYVGLAILCGLGGGVLRDSILQAGTVYIIDDALALPIAVVMGLLVFMFPRTFMKAPNLVGWWDIFAVGLFTIAGADKTMVLGKLPAVIILMGTITGVGGGMLRDIFLGEVPRIFKKGNLYASCSVACATLYYFFVTIMYVRKPFAAGVSIAFCMLIRWLSVHYNYQLITDEIELNWKAQFKKQVDRSRVMRDKIRGARQLKATPHIPTFNEVFMEDVDPTLAQTMMKEQLEHEHKHEHEQGAQGEAELDLHDSTKPDNK